MSHLGLSQEETCSALQNYGLEFRPVLAQPFKLAS